MEALLLRVNLPDMEAVPSTSRLPDMEAELVNTQKPVTVSFWDKDAGPPAPQSSLIRTSAVPEANKAKWAGSKEREVTGAILSTPVSFTAMPLKTLLVSVPQENRPVEAFQSSFEVVAVSQSARPEP